MFVTRGIVGIYLAVFLFSSCEAQTARRTPVLVELFTSEGCSSCPPADALLAKLEREQPVPSAEIVILEEHVDYWDSLGWRDRFSSAQATERQRRYGTRFGLGDVYTPQMVVAGRSQFVGSDDAAAQKAIADAVRGPVLTLAVSKVQRAGTHLSAKVSAADGAPGQKADIFAALVAPTETTNVLAGENGGRTMRHAGVVLSMTRVGDIRDGLLSVDLETPASDKGLRVVLFAQEPGQKRVVGVASFDVPTEGSPHPAPARK